MAERTKIPLMAEEGWHRKASKALMLMVEESELLVATELGGSGGVQRMQAIHSTKCQRIQKQRLEKRESVCVSDRESE